MKIDIFTHVVPQKYKSALGRAAPNLEAHTAQMPTLYDLDLRFKILDKYDDVKQVLTLALTAALILGDPKHAVDFARLANDETAELVRKYPDRFFAGTASLPMTDMDAAVTELDRAIGKLGLKGVQLFTPAQGKQMDLAGYMPIFERMAHYELPVWIHPMKPIDRSGYKNYFIDHVFGWPFESTVAMTNLVFDGLFERFPGIKVIVHHCGALVPFFAQRIAEAYIASGTMHGMKHEGLARPLIDYFKMFYNDTALNGHTPGLMCGHALYGADHIVFGTDMPYDFELGERNIRQNIESVEAMPISDAEKKLIYEGNARALLNL